MKKLRKTHISLGTFKILAFKKDDLKSRIDPTILSNIKAKDKTPFFQAYVLAHPGEFTPEIVNDDQTAIIWSEKSIKSFEKINVNGTKLYYGHDTREELGEVVSSYFDMIDGKNSFVIIAYHKPEQVTKAKKCDICSQEALWNTYEQNGKVFAETVDELTGVAIMESAKEKPAFDGANRIASVYAHKVAIKSQEGNKIMPENTVSITFDMVRKAIRDMNIQPYQVFDFDQIKLDPQFSSKIPDPGPLQEQVENYKNEIETLKQTNSDLVSTQNKITAKQRFDEILSNGKYTDKQKEFLSGQFDKTNIEDLGDDSLNNFIAEGTKKYQEMANFFGATNEPQGDKPPQENQDGDDEGSYIEEGFDLGITL